MTTNIMFMTTIGILRGILTLTQAPLHIPIILLWRDALATVFTRITLLFFTYAYINTHDVQMTTT